jgi:hypothetical protein
MKLDSPTRRQFVLGALATTTAGLTLIGCSDDEDRPSDDELGDGDGESGTSESTGETETGETDETDDTSTSDESPDSESTTTTTTTTESTTESEEESTEDTEESTSETEESTESTETGDPVCPSGASGTVLRNHGHSMVVPAMDVQVGVQKVYNIQGNSGHNHSVTLTPADFSQLQLGNVVMKTSSFLAAHDHEVLVSCLL